MILAALLLSGIAVLVAGAAGGDAAALVVGVMLTLVLLAGLVWSLPTRRTPRLESADDRPRDARFPGFNRLYSAVWLSQTSARHVDLSLRPVLLRVLAAELEDHGPDAVRARIGERWWTLIDPERTAVSDSRVKGLDHRSMLQLLDALENR